MLHGLAFRQRTTTEYLCREVSCFIHPHLLCTQTHYRRTSPSGDILYFNLSPVCVDTLLQSPSIKRYLDSRFIPLHTAARKTPLPGGSHFIRLLTFLRNTAPPIAFRRHNADRLWPEHLMIHPLCFRNTADRCVFMLIALSHTLKTDSTLNTERYLISLVFSHLASRISQTYFRQ